MVAPMQGLWSRTALFHQVLPKDLEKVGALVRILHLDDAQRLFMEGDPCSGFFVVLEGQIRLHRYTEKGRDVTLNLVSAGGSFAEAAMFSGGVFPASAEAVGGTVLAHFPRGPFLRLLREDQELCFKVMESLAAWHHRLTSQVQQLSANDTGQRLLRWIQDQSREGVARLKVPKKVLAGQLGMAPETLSRQLKALRQQGVIEVDNRLIRLLPRQ